MTTQLDLHKNLTILLPSLKARQIEVIPNEQQPRNRKKGDEPGLRN